MGFLRSVNLSEVTTFESVRSGLWDLDCLMYLTEA